MALATYSSWNPFGVTMNLYIDSATATRTSATNLKVTFNVSWGVAYSENTTTYGMYAYNTNNFSEGTTIATAQQYNSSGSGSFAANYTIAPGDTSKSVSVTFRNYQYAASGSSAGQYSDKAVSCTVNFSEYTKYTVETHYYYDADGTNKWTWFNSSSTSVYHGYTFTPSNTTIPTGCYASNYFDVYNGDWSTYLSSGTVGSTSISVTQALKVKVYYNRNSYTISYNANGGTDAPAAQTKYYDVGLTLTTSGLPSKANSVKYVTVNYNANGGITPSPSSDKETQTTSYTFSHWNTASNNSGSSFDAGDTYPAGQNSNVTLYAQYTSTQVNSGITMPDCARNNSSTTGYVVTFNANGGSCSTASLTSTRTITYDCKGWTLAQNGSGQVYGVGTSQKNWSEGPHTLYAQWNTTYTNNSISLPSATRGNSTETGHTVTFDTRGGSSIADMTSTITRSYTHIGWATSSTATSNIYTASYTPSNATTLYAIYTSDIQRNSITPPSPTKAGYTFKGWTSSSTSNVVVTQPGEAITPVTDTTVYAVWEQNSWPVTYSKYPTSATIGNMPSDQTKYGGTALILSSTKPTRSSTNPGSYVITLDPNYTGATTSTKTAPRSTNYTFYNWYDSANSKYYSPGASYTTDAALALRTSWTSSTTTSSVSLTDASRPSEALTGYTVTFDGNGGTSGQASITNERTRNYTFNGWGESSAATTAVSSPYTPSSDITLYGIWSSSDTSSSITPPSASRSNTYTYYTTTFDANGGTCSMTSKQTTRTRSYTFQGWSTSSTATSGSTASFTPTSSHTRYAVWSSSYSYGSFTLPTPTRAGYKFLGWATSSAATSGTTGSYRPTSNGTLYAIWEPAGSVHIHDGSSYDIYLVKIYNGSSWDSYIPYVYDGNSWQVMT